MNINWEFLEEVEGKAITKGYVPKRAGVAIGQSGVTIATGVDLGAMSTESLEDLNLSPNLEDLLMPYVGLKKAVAISFLQNEPLIISKAQADELDQAIRGKFVKGLLRLWNGACKIPFEKLDQNKQTAIFSIVYQYGLNIPNRCPKYWKMVISGDWAGAEKELRNFGDAYDSRRKSEADLIKESLKTA